MKIYIAADHAGYELKSHLIKQLLAYGNNLEDCGAFNFDPLDDYPDFIIPAAKKVAQNPHSKGIIIGGSGQGEAMAANRIQGIRAAVYYDGPLDIIKLHLIRAIVKQNLVVILLGIILLLHLQIGLCALRERKKLFLKEIVIPGLIKL